MGKTDPTLDWITETTGEARGHLCDGGHDWYLDGEVDFVLEAPAAFLRCARCGRRGYHWLPPDVKTRALRDGELHEWELEARRT